MSEQWENSKYCQQSNASKNVKRHLKMPKTNLHKMNNTVISRWKDTSIMDIMFKYEQKHSFTANSLHIDQVHTYIHNLKQKCWRKWTKYGVSQLCITQHHWDQTKYNNLLHILISLMVEYFCGSLHSWLSSVFSLPTLLVQ